MDSGEDGLKPLDRGEDEQGVGEEQNGRSRHRSRHACRVPDHAEVAVMAEVVRSVTSRITSMTWERLNPAARNAWSDPLDG